MILKDFLPPFDRLINETTNFDTFSFRRISFSFSFSFTFHNNRTELRKTRMLASSVVGVVVKFSLFLFENVFFFKRIFLLNLIYFSLFFFSFGVWLIFFQSSSFQMQIFNSLQSEKRNNFWKKLKLNWSLSSTPNSKIYL